MKSLSEFCLLLGIFSLIGVTSGCAADPLAGVERHRRDQITSSENSTTTSQSVSKAEVLPKQQTSSVVMPTASSDATSPNYVPSVAQTSKIHPNEKFDIQDRVDRMLKNGQPMLTGKSKTHGSFIISIYQMEDPGVSRMELAEIALAEGKKQIAAFVNQRIEAEDKLISRSVSKNEDFSSEATLDTFIKTNINELLRGVILYSIQTKGKMVTSVCFLTGKTLDRSAELKKQMSKMPPDTVASSGFAYIVDRREDVAKQQAMHAALRSAVEQVLGTVLAGNTQIQDSEKVRSRIFAQSKGFVEQYRIVTESADGGCYRIEIIAKISKNKLQESYSSYLKTMGDPSFYIRTQNKELYQTFVKFFNDLGLRLVGSPNGADYYIDAMGDYRQVIHPVSKEIGTQLSLWIRIFDTKTNQELLSQKNDPRKAAVFYSSGERQKDIATEKAFKQMKQPLHLAIDNMIGRMMAAGRYITVRINGFTPAKIEAVKRITAALENVSGISSVNCKINSADNTVIYTANYTGKIEDLESLLRFNMNKELNSLGNIPRTISLQTNCLDMAF